MPLRFSLRAFLIFCSIFAIEIIIALFIRDTFIRPFLGDVLVVIMIFYFFRSFCECSIFKLAVGVLLFSILIEISQYLDLVDILGIDDYEIAHIILGSTFDWLDILAYLLGTTGVYFFEKRNRHIN